MQPVPCVLPHFRHRGQTQEAPGGERPLGRRGAAAAAEWRGVPPVQVTTVVSHLEKTRYGPNRPAADMERKGEFDFWGIFEDFWRHS